MSQSLLLRLSIILALVAAALAGMIGYRYAQDRQTVSEGDLTPLYVSPTSTRPGGGERAQVTVVKTTPSVARGRTWSVEIATSDWARCLVDLYDPSGALRRSRNAEPVSLSRPPTWLWVWPVPRDVAPGKWTARLLCGTYDNLAIKDVTVNVE